MLFEVLRVRLAANSSRLELSRAIPGEESTGLFETAERRQLSMQAGGTIMLSARLVCNAASCTASSR
jgi:hypothetical protein